MPKILYDRAHNSHYLYLHEKLINAIGYDQASKVRFVKDSDEHFLRLIPDTESRTSSSSLVRLPRMHTYRVVIPAALIDFCDLETGQWLKFIYYNREDGLVIMPTLVPYGQAADRLDIKLIILRTTSSRHFDMKPASP
jgi:hypothetical protein